MMDASSPTWGFIFKDSSGNPIAYDLRGPSTAPLLVLLPSLGTSAAMWDEQMLAFTSWFRVLRVEHPGHGKEGFSHGPYTIEMLARRVIELVDSIGNHNFSLLGLSLGGMVAMQIAAACANRVESLVLCCTAPVIGPAEMWRERAANVRRHNVRPTKETVAARWFTSKFVAAHSDVVDRFYEDFTAIDGEAYALCCETLAQTDLTDELARIVAPTLVVAGASDPVISVQSAAATATAINGASLIVLPRASHLPNVEASHSFNTAVLQHLIGDVTDRGNATRRLILGEDYVAGQGGDGPKQSFDKLVADMYWGEVWSRPGIDRRTRRLLNIAMLVCLRHAEGIALHTRAALRDDISPEVLHEVLLQSAVVAGVPAANTARHIVNRIIDEERSGA